MSGLRWALIEVMPFSLKDQTYIFINTNAGFCSTGLPLSSRWAPVLRPKTSKTFVQTSKFFSFYLDIYKNKFKNLIWTSKFNFSFRGLFTMVSHIQKCILINWIFFITQYQEKLEICEYCTLVHFQYIVTVCED